MRNVRILTTSLLPRLKLWMLLRSSFTLKFSYFSLLFPVAPVTAPFPSLDYLLQAMLHELSRLKCDAAFYSPAENWQSKIPKGFSSQRTPTLLQHEMLKPKYVENAETHLLRSKNVVLTSCLQSHTFPESVHQRKLKKQHKRLH